MGRLSLAIGTLFLSAMILIGDLTAGALNGQRLGEILRESFLIGGWVAMWRPLEIFLYDWWPIRAAARLFDRFERHAGADQGERRGGVNPGDGSEPARPGTYGRPPREYRLPDNTRLGPAHLQVADLDRSLPFYQTTLGLRVLQRDGAHARLGAHDSDTLLLMLHERPGARAALSRGRLGLFHFAILLPDRPSLGRFVRHLAEIGAASGAADHLVSESVYLQDPDNLGIEVYADRSRDTWRRVGRQLMMATEPLDRAGLERAAGASLWTGMPRGTVMGHVHLHVGDLATASAFFSDGLGLDVTVWDYPGALFFAASGYHHHLGANTWAGRNAQPPAEDDAQLLEWTIELPDATALASLADNLAHAGYPVARVDQNDAEPALLTRDPWGSRLRVWVAQAGPRAAPTW